RHTRWPRDWSSDVCSSDLQSEISVAVTGVIPGYPYPTVNPQRGTLRLDLFNAQDLLAITPTVKDALAKDPRWERTFDLPPYAIRSEERRVGKECRAAWQR